MLSINAINEITILKSTVNRDERRKLFDLYNNELYRFLILRRKQYIKRNFTA